MPTETRQTAKQKIEHVINNRMLPEPFTTLQIRDAAGLEKTGEVSSRMSGLLSAGLVVDTGEYADEPKNTPAKLYRYPERDVIDAVPAPRAQKLFSPEQPVQFEGSDPWQVIRETVENNQAAFKENLGAWTTPEAIHHGGAVYEYRVRRVA